MSPYIRLNTLFLVSWIPQNTLIFLFGNICKKQAVIPICTRTISWLLVENIPAISLISSISLHFSVTSNLVAVTCKASRVTRYRNEKKGDPTISYCSLSTESYSYYSLVPISSNDNHNSILQAAFKHKICYFPNYRRSSRHGKSRCYQLPKQQVSIIILKPLSNWLHRSAAGKLQLTKLTMFSPSTQGKTRNFSLHIRWLCFYWRKVKLHPWFWSIFQVRASWNSQKDLCLRYQALIQIADTELQLCPFHSISMAADSLTSANLPKTYLIPLICE